jgi:hypothetical protein
MNIQRYGSTDLTLLTAHFGISLLHNSTAFQSQGHEQRYRDASAVQVAVFGTARGPYFSLAIISVTVQLWI